MGVFVLAAALLVAATLLLLLRPWKRTPKLPGVNVDAVNAGVYRDQLAELDRDLAAGTLSAADHQQARTELQRRMLDDTTGSTGGGTAPAATTGGMRGTALSLAIALPLAAVGLYAWLGAPAALDPVATRAPQQQDVEKMVAELAARMEKSPDPRGFVVLARSYRVMGRLPEAEAAFERIGPALQENATLLAEYADVLASRAMGNFDGKPLSVVQQALKLDPENPMALSLAATAAYNRNDYAQAVTLWEKLLKIVPAGSDDAQWLQQALAKTRDQLKDSPATATSGATTAPAAPAVATAAPDAATITGRVSLAPALAARAQPGDTVFIFARPAQGSRMPLAVQRARVSDLPFDFKLDDSMAMSPAAKLSGAREVRIEARISRSGSANPESGDLIGASGVVQPGARQVQLVIDQARP